MIRCRWDESLRLSPNSNRLFEVVDCFTDSSRLLVALLRHRGFILWRICSLQVHRQTDSLCRAVRSLFRIGSESFGLVLLFRKLGLKGPSLAVSLYDAL